MNINLVAVALSNQGRDELANRFHSAVEYGKSIYGDATDYIRVGEDRAIFNSGRLSGTWSVPTWLEWGGDIAAFSQPPIPVNETVVPSTYSAAVKPAVLSGQFESFLPNHFGILYRSDGSVVVWNDSMGMGRCYYVLNEHFFAACNHIGTLAFFLDGPVEIDRLAVGKFTGAGFFMDDDAPYLGIRRLYGGHQVSISADKVVSQKDYFDVSTLVSPTGDRPDYEGVATEMGRVAKNLDNLTMRTATVYLSGGRDSRMTAGLWLAGGSDARVVTMGTLQKEADIAADLMGRFTPRPGQDIVHDIKVANSSDVTQDLKTRVETAFAMWDGDAAPTNIKRNLTIPTGRAALSIGGVGGEIMHGYYYSRPGQLEKVSNSDNPVEFAISGHGHRYLTDDSAEALMDSFSRYSSRAQHLGLDNFSSLDYLYMFQKLRRWGNQALTSTSAILLSTPAFVRGCFNLEPEEKVRKDFPVHLVDVALPNWSGVDYYKADPNDSKILMKRGLATFQSDPEGFFELLGTERRWAQYVKPEMVDHFVELAKRDEATYAHESWLNTMIWVEEIERHAKRLTQTVKRFRQQNRQARSIDISPVQRSIDTSFLEGVLRTWPLVKSSHDKDLSNDLVNGCALIGREKVDLSDENMFSPDNKTENKNFLVIHSLRWIDPLLRFQRDEAREAAWTRLVTQWWENTKYSGEENRLWGSIVTVQRASAIALGGVLVNELPEDLLSRHLLALKKLMAQGLDPKLLGQSVAALLLITEMTSPESLDSPDIWREVKSALSMIIRPGGTVFSKNANDMPAESEYWLKFVNAIDPNGDRLADLRTRFEETEFWIQAHQPDGHVVPYGAQGEPTKFLNALTDAKYVRSKGVQGGPATAVRFVDQQGLITGRSGWGETERPFSEETFWSILCGPVRDKNEHQDLGRLTFSSQGVNWLVDPIGEAFASDELHSSVRVLDRKFRTNGSADLVSARETPIVDDYVVRMNTYLPVAWRRHVTFVRTGNYLVVEDYLNASREFSAELNWMVNPSVSVTVNRNRAVLECDGKTAELVFSSTQSGDLIAEPVLNEDGGMVAIRLRLPAAGKTVRVLTVISDVYDPAIHTVTRNVLRGNEYSFTVKDKGIEEQLIATQSGSGVLPVDMPAEEGVEQVLQEIASGELSNEEVVVQRDAVRNAIARVKADIWESNGSVKSREDGIAKLKAVIPEKEVYSLRDHGMAAALIDIAGVDLKNLITDIAVVNNYRRSSIIDWSGENTSQEFYQVPVYTTRSTAQIPDFSEDKQIWSVDFGELVTASYNVAARGDTLVVYFHGATDRTRHATPRFERLRSFSTIGIGPLMFFADPNLDLDARMILSWFAGDEKTNNHLEMARMIDEYARRSGVEHVILVGNSGGGFTALQVSSYLRGVEVISVNGQVDLGRYQPRIADPAFRALRGYPGSMEEISACPRMNVIARFRESGFNNRVLMFQNEGDDHHFLEHYKPFEEEFAEAAGERFNSRVEFLGEGHVAPSADYYVEVIREWAARARDTGDRYQGLADTSSLM